jgi:hypothetical protein
MRSVETEWWTIALPEEWEAEDDDGSVVITDLDEVSQVQISAVRKEAGDVSQQDLQEFTADLRAEGKTSRQVKLGGMNAELYEYEEVGEFWREWFVMKGNLLIFITHCCESANRGMDDSAVDEILNTIEITTG